ncbi:GTPase HflX [Flagellatimonas centrodinii]|uniref:ribosome rescue GTPase HflX n=1 Tax=Flagellatimonas centrodinii TaxID=2806210 RepID=UPI001FEEAE06|nr:ribosome rescue GTPase HflX [Flagellatimonas centrodinii]ULQ45749.1 GTPase HflX [Flagellatimonas centrodinii]
MFERPKSGQQAVLVHLELPGADYASDRQEFIELAHAAGASVLSVIGGSRRQPDPGLFVGSGKAEEVAASVAEQQAELAIFNHDLSPSQERNLERLLKCRVVGRGGLILDIFAQRARSHEGKLQVELAQLQHMSTRLVRGWTHLERQRGGGIGLRGPGETQLELDRRMIRDRIATLKRHLEAVRGRRAENRRARQRNETPVVSLVGYTNAGKSSLFNALTADDSFASRQLFATLDTTIRKLSLPTVDQAVLADTVGFIRDLPHDLVAAFRATLEEAREADLLLHVIDVSDPERMARVEQVNEVLEAIGADTVPTLQVFNKIDLQPDRLPGIERDAQGRPHRVSVSALSVTGIGALREAIAERLTPDSHQAFSLRVPARAGRLRAQLFAHRAVRAEVLDDQGAFQLQVEMDYPRLRGLCEAAGVTPPPAPGEVEDWEREGVK